MFLRKPVNTSVLGYWTSFLKNGQNGPLISRAVMWPHIIFFLFEFNFELRTTAFYTLLHFIPWYQGIS